MLLWPCCAHWSHKMFPSAFNVHPEKYKFMTTPQLQSFSEPINKIFLINKLVHRERNKKGCQQKGAHRRAVPATPQNPLLPGPPTPPRRGVVFSEDDPIFLCHRQCSAACGPGGCRRPTAALTRLPCPGTEKRYCDRLLPSARVQNKNKRSKAISCFLL